MKKIAITKKKYFCTNVQIILNDNYTIQFENYDFQFLKSYLTMEIDNNYKFHFNNSLKSIIMINSNNKKEPYIHTSAYYLQNNSHICLNNKCNIKYTIQLSDFNKYRNKVIKNMIQAITRQLKYSARGFNCLDTYFQINNNDIWFIYDFYLDTIPEQRIDCGKRLLNKLISECSNTQIAIKDCFLMEKYNITLIENNNNGEKN
jgi:hypothetical protein